MMIQLVRRGVTFDEGFRAFIEEKVDLTLSHLRPQVRWVRILLEDTNGPKGGLDKRCLVAVGGDGFETRVVEVREAGLYPAAARALQIIARAVVRVLGRERRRVGSRRKRRSVMP